MAESKLKVLQKRLKQLVTIIMIIIIGLNYYQYLNHRNNFQVFFEKERKKEKEAAKAVFNTKVNIKMLKSLSCVFDRGY